MLPWRNDPDDEGADVVELHPVQGRIEVLDEPEIDAETEASGSEIEPWRPRSVLAARLATVADRTILPPREHLSAAARYYGRDLARGAGWLLTHPLHPLLFELRHFFRGVAVTWVAWRAWVTESHWAEEISAMPKESASRGPAATKWAEARSGHRRLSAVVALLVAVATAMACIWWPTDLIVAGISLMAIFDVVGRRHPDLDVPPPPVRRHLLQEGMPTRALGDQIAERLQMDGLRADLAGQVQVHPGGEYRVLITHEDAIEPKHLRMLERGLAGRPMSFRLIGTEDAGTSELRIPTRDHLARVPARLWAPTGSRSIADPADLWLRSDGDPSSPVLAGIHTDMVGTTGSGKTEGLQEIISFFGECKDVYPVFIDLTCGPVGPLNKRTLRKTAYDVESAEALLDWALERVEERHLILHRLAESDDDDAPVTWDLSWGPQIEIIIDEYSFISQYPELHAKVEAIMRVGRKVKICVIRASQKSGNNDLGSTVASSLVGLKILLACTERDTTSMLSTQHRDRGWSPHEFRPAVPGDARDAGKCFVWGPSHRDPEIHRFHAPLEPGEVKRRDRQRHTDGLPNLDGTRPGEQEAILLSPTQEAVEKVFAERAAHWLPTRVIQSGLVDRGITISDAALGVELGSRDGNKVGSLDEWDFDDGKGVRQVRGYRLVDIHQAWGATE